MLVIVYVVVGCGRLVETLSEVCAGSACLVGPAGGKVNIQVQLGGLGSGWDQVEVGSGCQAGAGGRCAEFYSHTIRRWKLKITTIRKRDSNTGTFRRHPQVSVPAIRFRVRGRIGARLRC